MRSKRLSSPSVKQVHQFSSPGPLQVHSAQFFKSQVPAKEPLAEGVQVLELASSAREPAIDAVSFLFSAVNLSFAAVSFLFAYESRWSSRSPARRIATPSTPSLETGRGGREQAARTFTQVKDERARTEKARRQLSTAG